MQSGQTSRTWALITTLLMSSATSAHAATIGLSPLFPSGVDSKTIQGVHQLLEAELEFAPDIERTVALPTRPPVWVPNACRALHVWLASQRPPTPTSSWVAFFAPTVPTSPSNSRFTT